MALLPVKTPALPPGLWLSLLRLLWFCGYGGSVESFRHARRRAAQAASQLIALSERGAVLLAGHGLAGGKTRQQPLLEHGGVSPRLSLTRRVSGTHSPRRPADAPDPSCAPTPARPPPPAKHCGG